MLSPSSLIRPTHYTKHEADTSGQANLTYSGICAEVCEYYYRGKPTDEYIVICKLTLRNSHSRLRHRTNVLLKYKELPVTRPNLNSKTIIYL